MGEVIKMNLDKIFETLETISFWIATGAFGAFIVWVLISFVLEYIV